LSTYNHLEVNLNNVQSCYETSSSSSVKFAREYLESG